MSKWRSTKFDDVHARLSTLRISCPQLNIVKGAFFIRCLLLETLLGSMGTDKKKDYFEILRITTQSAISHKFWSTADLT